MRVPFLSGRGRRHLAAAVATVTLAALLPAGTAAAAAPGYPPQTINWGPCWWYTSDLGGQVPQCATVTVPRDWANPGAGPTLQIAISRVKATDPAHRKGILFTNPGGPGGGGTAIPWYLALLHPNVAADYDVIGMDPRGVGDGTDTGSTDLECDVPADQLNAIPTYDGRDQSGPAVAARQAFEKLLADSCAKNPLTRYVNTWQTTHDMDLIRAQLGAAKLNYLGYSYGTWLGAKYAAMFPANAGKVVLDSNTAWMDDLSSSWQLMPMSVQRRYEEQFLAWTTRSPFFSPQLGTTTAQVNSWYERDRAAYAAAHRQWGLGNDGGDLIDGTMFGVQYSDIGLLVGAIILGLVKTCLIDTTSATPDAFVACENDYFDQAVNYYFPSKVDAQFFRAQVQQIGAQLSGRAPATGIRGAHPYTLASLQAKARIATDDTVQVNDVYDAVRCGDGGQWHSPSWWVDYARQFGPQYPIGAYLVSQEVCSWWTLPAQPLPNPDPRASGPIVTVENELDPATAYESTARNVAQFHDARLIAVDNAGPHGAYAIEGNPCVDAAVDAYLNDDVPPPTSTVCGAIPLFAESTVFPVPGPVDGKTPPKAVHAALVNPRIQQLLYQLIR
jgi:pimeloyl-ACP methyl ester carboxylesterase